MVLLRRRGAKPTRLAAGLLRASFVCSFVLAIVSLHGQATPPYYPDSLTGYAYYVQTLGIPPLVRDWTLGTPADDWVSMAVCSDGSYGVPEGLISDFPCTTNNGKWEIVQGLDIDPFSRERIDASVAELGEERDQVAELGLI